MALQKTVNTPQGFEALNAYHRIKSIGFNSKEMMTFSVFSYKSNTSDVEFKINSYVCGYEMDGQNPFKQAYAHLKTLDEFAGSVDC